MVEASHSSGLTSGQVSESGGVSITVDLVGVSVHELSERTTSPLH